MLELIVQKKKNTKVVLDGEEFFPDRGSDTTDYYELPCDDGRLHDLEVVHYAGTTGNGVLAVIGDRPTPARSVLHEMGSATTSLYFCRLKMKIIAKLDAVLHCMVNRICTIDRWGQTSYCSISVEDSSRAKVLEKRQEYYPSRDTRKKILAIESGLTVANVILYTAVVLVIASLLASSVINLFLGAMLLVFLIPLGIAGLIVLAWRAVSCYKHSGPPSDRKRK